MLRVISLLGVLLLLASCGGPSAPPPSVVLIVVDTLRADHLGCYGDPEVRTPFLDALAARGAQFRCQSQAPWTLPATATILSGLYPAGHATNAPRRTLPEYLPLVTEVFRDAGYSTAGFVSHDLVSADYGFNRGFSAWDDSNAGGHRWVSSDSVTALAVSWLEPVQEPVFLFVHYFDPHYDYLAHPGWTRPIEYEGEIEEGANMWTTRKRIPFLGADDARFLRNLYRGEIAMVDASLHRLFRVLEGLGIEPAVVMTADHGEEFLEHGWLGHTRNLRQVVMDVPMLVSAPGRIPSGPRPERAMQVDVRPTLQDLARLPAPGTPGVSLAGAVPAVRDLYSEVTYDANEFAQGGYQLRKAMGLNKRADMRSLVRWPWKIVWDRLEQSWSLYDLESDPGELADVSADHPDVLERLRPVVEENEAAIPGEVGEQITLTDEDLEKLRGLGYVN
ncbi:MAG TPA: sulfatase [bacterium]|nr:sulfatase [bacterium]